MFKKLPQRHTLSIGDVDEVAVDLSARLDSDEVLTGTPTVVEIDDTGSAVASSDLTISSVQVNTATYTDELQVDPDGIEKTVAIGKAVIFMLSTSGTSAASHLLLVTATSDKTPARVLKRVIEIAFE